MARPGFETAYQGLLARWPQPVEAIDVDTCLGRTRVHGAGRPDADPVLLIGGGGAPSPVWADVAAGLAPDHRVLALDVPGDAGLSAAPTHRPRGTGEVAGWLEDVLSGLGLDRVVVVGHSYGAWLALVHALAHPARLRHLVLVDPTDCFTRPSPTYLAHALPLFVTASARAHRSFLGWETAGRGIDPDAAALWAAPGRPAVLLRPSRPSAQQLAGLGVPVSVLLAEHSRAHDVDAVARQVRARLPGATIATLAGVSHHAIPTEHPDRLAAHVRDAAGHP